MKHLVIIILMLATTLLVGRSLFTPSVRAQSVGAADQDLSRTERDLHKVLNATAATAHGLQDRLGSADRITNLPKDVEQFLTSTHRLERLRDELREDIDHLAAASARTLTAFDRERAAITDPITRHAMTSLRTTARQQTAERLTSARQALDLLGRVLIQGNDVAHAARCVQLAEELNASGETLNERVRAATEEANRYTSMTNDLLGRLTSAYTE